MTHAGGGGVPTLPRFIFNDASICGARSVYAFDQTREGVDHDGFLLVCVFVLLIVTSQTKVEPMSSLDSLLSPATVGAALYLTDEPSRPTAPFLK